MHGMVDILCYKNGMQCMGFFDILCWIIRAKSALTIIVIIKENNLKRKWEEKCDVRVTSRSSPLSPDLSRTSVDF